MDQLITFNGKTLIELLRFRAELQPDSLAYMVQGDKHQEFHSITYSELEERAIKLAITLQALDLKGERVLLMYPTGIDYIIGFFATVFAGAIAVPIYEPRYNNYSKRLMNIIHDCGAKGILANSTVLNSERVMGQLEEYGVEWIFTDELPYQQNTIYDWIIPATNCDSTVFLQYTSGSTGNPKGVQITHRSLLHNLKMIRELIQPDMKTRLVSFLPLYHDMGLVSGVLQPIFAGFPCLLMSPFTVMRKPINWLRAISDYKATISGGPNFFYEACNNKISASELEELDLSHWKIAFNGAEPVNPHTIKKFTNKFSRCGFHKNAFLPCYGLAESTLLVASVRPLTGASVQCFSKNALSQGIACLSDAKDAQPIVSYGFVHKDIDVRIVDRSTSRVCIEGEIGEIWVNSDSVASGYWDDDKQTNKEFGAALCDGTGPFLCTGDLGFMLNGELFVTGRLKDLIIIRGKNHYPQDIEYSARQCHDVFRNNTSAAFSINKGGSERLVVMLEVKKTQVIQCLEEPIEALRSTISKNHDLQAYDIVLVKRGGIPRTTSGKIRRKACKQIYLDRYYPRKQSQGAAVYNL